MDIYLLKFSACLLVFWLVYILFLERQKMHHLKRFYLLVSVFLSLTIPLLTITYYIEPVVNNFVEMPMTVPFETSLAEVPLQEESLFTLERVLWLIYGLGVVLFATRFIVNLAKLYRQISTNDKVSARNFIYVLLKDYRIPHSFFKYIFLNKTKFENDSIPKEVILHEETHAKQMHSLDVLIIELLQIVFWFHPLIYILKHHIKLNHEFLADQAVLNNGIDQKKYQNILLQFSSNTQNYQLSSAINYSSIKKRFTVMKTQTSKTRIWVSALLLLPIIAILYYSFAEKEYVERDYLSSNLSDVSKSQLDKVKTYREAADNYNKAVRLFINDNRYIDDERAKYLKSVADDLFKSFSDEEKTQFNIFKTRPIPYSDEEATDLFYYNEPVLRIDSEQNLWLNNKKTTLKTLEEDFNSIIQFAGTGVRLKTETRVSAEIVEKIMSALGPNLSVLAFSPKEATVYNPNYKQEKVTEKEVEAYNVWAKKIHAESKKLSKDATWYPPINEQDLIKYSGIYNRMSVQQKKQAIEHPFPDLDISGTEENISVTEQQKATKKQIAAYNTWAKAINDKMAKAKANNDVNEYPIVKVKEVNKYKAIYAIMTEAQKKVAEPWPSFPPPPPPAPERATVIEIAEYDVWAKKMNIAIKKAESGNNKSYYPRIKKEDYDKYYNIYSTLMTEAQRETAEPWPNIPPPQPPPPPAPETPKNKSNDSPNVNSTQQTVKIQPIEIIIDSNKNIQLNGKIIDFDAINGEVEKLNQNLSNEDHRKYVTASIALEKNKYLDLAKTIQKELKKANVWINSISYNENINKSGVPKKPFSLYSGLTLEEAKAKEKKIFNEPITIDTTKSSPWKVSVGMASYEYIDDNGKSTGKIYLNSKNEDKQDELKIYVNKKELSGAKIIATPAKTDSNTQQKEENNLTQTKKPLKIKEEAGEDNSNISSQKAMSFTFSSLKNAKKIDWDLKKAFKDNFESLKNGDSIRVVLEIDDKIMVDNKIINDYKSEFTGTFGEIDIMYEKIKNHIRELKRN